MNSRQPIFNIPAAVLASIVVMGAIHAGRLLLSDHADASLLARFAFVPGRMTLAVDPAAVMNRLTELLATDPARSGSWAAARFFLGDGRLQPWTVLTYALLHGSWTHFGLNAIWLLAFGSPVARRLGSWRFLVLFAAAALAGAAAHFAVDPLSLQPLIGASAAVSGCMGAALRFMFRAPRRADEPPVLSHGAPRLSLAAVFRDRRAAGFLAVWFITNLVTGLGAVPLGLSDMPIAWQAHVGGLVFGLLAFPLLDRVPPATEPTAAEPDVPEAAPGEP